jgi:hypothetical protein
VRRHDDAFFFRSVLGQQDREEKTKTKTKTKQNNGQEDKTRRQAKATNARIVGTAFVF